LFIVCGEDKRSGEKGSLLTYFIRCFGEKKIPESLFKMNIETSQEKEIMILDREFAISIFRMKVFNAELKKNITIEIFDGSGIKSLKEKKKLYEKINPGKFSFFSFFFF
jgi:hypothetical protein